MSTWLISAQTITLQLETRRSSFMIRMQVTKTGGCAMKPCYPLLITAGIEMEGGGDNLWKSGSATGRRDYPIFGQYCTINMFSAFRSASPMAWTAMRAVV
jgi:hypothetical protein